ncbi:MAG: glycosyltransferase family 39 protein [Saprospiraceae bacterium]|nr:glycosyltransferase family 39 protein [Saprospiraceae bacterium]
MAAQYPKIKSLFLPTDTSARYFWIGFGLLVVVIAGLFLDVMDVDAAQYASIALEMTQNGSWLQVMHRGVDYLDKPPLVFWVSAASFELFGVSNWAYKLPSVIAAVAGVWATYRFALLFYDPKTARQGAFILASSIGLLVICNDIRTDTLLLGMTACSIWQLAAYLKNGNLWRLAGGFFFAGMAMLAKGPIGLVVPGFAVGVHLAFTRRWIDFLRWQWLAGLAVTALVLAPMCWGLWMQFDQHPEKMIDGRQGVSGLYFFFWEQSFGRITGENKWRNDASVFYFLHVYLWAFLPWYLLLPGAWWQAVRKKMPEYYALGAFTLTFIALSLSKYKLPHYIFITLPWASVLLAAALNKRTDNQVGKLHWSLFYLTALVGLTIAVLTITFVFPTTNPAIWACFLLGTGFLTAFILKRPFPVDSDILIQRGVGISLIIGFILNFHFYPNLLPYQSAKTFAHYARAQGIAPEKLAYFHRGSHALDFYNGRYLEQFEEWQHISARIQTSGPFWIHADEAGKGELEMNKIPFTIEKRFDHFQVALLRPAFLNPATRVSALDTIYLLKVGGH